MFKLANVLQLYYNNHIILTTKIMRQVLSLSLHEDQVKRIKLTAKNKGFKSVSSYVQKLLTEDRDLITEEELIEDWKIAKKEQKAGKLIKANSLIDLL